MRAAFGMHTEAGMGALGCCGYVRLVSSLQSLAWKVGMLFIRPVMTCATEEHEGL